MYVMYVYTYVTSYCIHVCNASFYCSFDYNTPYIVMLGKGYIIQGMDRGLVGTCLYERRRITFPASLGYGEAGVGEKIPPNASLTFYIRMVKIVRVSVCICVLCVCVCVCVCVVCVRMCACMRVVHVVSACVRVCVSMYNTAFLLLYV